jgi:hypothetical protein
MTRSHALSLTAAAIIVAMGPGAASAQSATGASPAVERPALLARLVACRSVADPSARLACYDTAAGALDTAEQQGEVVIVDRNQVNAARRQLFGFSVPAMPSLFERGDQPAEQVDSIESTLTRAYQNNERRWVFTLADGSVWRQIDVDSVRFRNRGNPPVRVRRGALGSFLLTIDGSRAVRVHRE